MLFNSVHFVFFFPIVAILYFVLRPNLRWMLLLGASYYFYMAWEPVYAVLILASTTVDYVAAIQIRGSKLKSHKIFWLILSLITNLGLLFAFKYYNFFAGSLAGVFEMVGMPLEIKHSSLLLPVGISFYTFQTLSYTIECYKGNQTEERHFGIFALYVAFFPQLVAGPIERPQNLLKQFRNKIVFEYDRVAYGLKRMAWGMFKKVVVADRLAPLVNTVYNDAGNHDGPALVVATIFFAFQIYCDFSGYSDIAIGAAKVLGFDLMENFKRPYHSRSVSEFWRKWHISLSTWFRDYVYFPLGGMKNSLLIRCGSLVTVFLVSGLWHGANWTFVIWGGLHGLYLLASLLLARRLKGVRKFLFPASRPFRTAAIQITFTFILVNLAWIFFRANSVTDAFYIVSHLHTGWDMDGIKLVLLGFGQGRLATIGAFLAIASVLIFDIIDDRGHVWDRLARCHWILRWLIYYGIAAGLVLLGVYNESAFIYFQF